MRKPSRAVAGVAVLLALASAGCSSGGDQEQDSQDGQDGAPSAAPSQSSQARGTGYAPYASATAASRAERSGSAEAYNLAFVVAGDDGCTPTWGGSRAVDDGSVVNRIDALAKSAKPRVSFGGESGNELARGCGSVSELKTAYERVLRATGATRLDFDIEGEALTDKAANVLRNQAVAEMEEENGDLEVTYTLPVMPDAGLNDDAVALLKNSQKRGVDVHHVNIMAMNYGSAFSGDMGGYAVKSAKQAHGQLARILGQSSPQAWRSLAITVMPGDNEIAGETFTLNDAVQLRKFAQQKKIAWLSAWSTGRDLQCSAGDTSAPGRPSATCSGAKQRAGAFAEALSGRTRD